MLKARRPSLLAPSFSPRQLSFTRLPATFYGQVCKAHVPTLPNNPASSRRPGGTVCVAKRARWPTAFSTLALKHGMPGEKVPRVRVVLGSWGLRVSGVAGWSGLSRSPQPPYQAAPIIIPTLQTNPLILRGAEALAQGPAYMMHQSQVLNPVPTIPTPTWHCLHRC